MLDLKAILRANGKRQRDIAVACGVSEPTASRWVEWVRSNGERGVPVPAMALPAIAKVAGVAVADLLPTPREG